MHTDHISITAYLLHAGLSYIITTEPELIFIISKYCYVEGLKQFGKGAACISKTDYPYRFTAQFCSPVLLPDPLAIFNFIKSKINLIHQVQQETEGMLSYCSTVTFGTAHASYSFLFSISHINQFHSTTQPADPF